MILTLYTSAQTVPDIRIRSDCSPHRNNIGRARPLVTSKQISVQFGSSFVSRFYFRLSVSMKNHDSCSCISDIAKQILSLFIPRSRKTSWKPMQENKIDRRVYASYRRVRTRHKQGIEYDIEDTNACPVKWLASRYMTAGSFARSAKKPLCSRAYTRCDQGPLTMPN